MNKKGLCQQGDKLTKPVPDLRAKSRKLNHFFRIFAAKRQTLHSSLKGEKQQKRLKKDKKNTHHLKRQWVKVVQIKYYFKNGMIANMLAALMIMLQIANIVRNTHCLYKRCHPQCGQLNARLAMVLPQAGQLLSGVALFWPDPAAGFRSCLYCE